MSFESAETRRKLGNILKFGEVVSIDGDRAVVKLDYGNGTIETAPLPWSERAGKSRTWSPPSPGQQVLVASPSGDPANGIIIGSAYSDSFSAPSDDPDITRWEFGDGSIIEVDEKGGLLSIAGAKNLTVKCAGVLTLDAPSVVIKGALSMISTEGGATRAVLNGHLIVTEDTVSGGISDTGHRHRCPSCGSLTDPPQ